MEFSQRIGKRPIKTMLQVESVDDDLKNRLWNVILEDFFGTLIEYDTYGQETEKGSVCRLLWKEFYKKPIDEIPLYRTGTVNTHRFMEFVRDFFFKAEWYRIYDLIEFIASIDKQRNHVDFITECNFALEIEVSGYRIVNEIVVQITSEEEIQAIEESMKITEVWNPVNIHLQTALNMLAERKTPDYRNSIKESISAVEALCIIITNDASATLGKALTEIEKKHSIHGALKTAFSAIYGYTSDSGGIRHSLIEGNTKVEFEDAKFMLVSCSAFINYLKSKMQT